MKDFFVNNKRNKKNRNTKENIEHDENEENENEDEFEEALSEYKYARNASSDDDLSKYRKAFASKKKNSSSHYFDIYDEKETNKSSNELKKYKNVNVCNSMNDYKYNQITGLNLTNYLLVPDEIRHKYTKPFLFQISKRLLIMKQPWRLPKNVELQTNNIDHISNYIKVLERISTEYLNDPPINYYYRGLELYNKNVFANIDYLLKKVEIKNSEKTANCPNLIKINDCYYDLNTFGKSPNNIFYQSYIIWDIHGNNLTLAEEYDKYFESQILDYAFGEKEYPNLKYILNICSTILFWLNFNKKENFAIINYHKASSFILLILSCVMLSIDTSLTFEQVQEILYKSSKIYNEHNDDVENEREMERELKMKFHKEMEVVPKMGIAREETNDIYDRKREHDNKNQVFSMLNDSYSGMNLDDVSNNYFTNNDFQQPENLSSNSICNYQTPNNSYDTNYVHYSNEKNINSSIANFSEKDFLKNDYFVSNDKENNKRNSYINKSQLNAPCLNGTDVLYEYEKENFAKKKKSKVDNNWAFSLKTREIEKKNKKAKDHHFWIPFEYWKPSHKRYFNYFSELIKNKNKKIENNTFKLKSIIFSDYTSCTLSIEVYEIVFKDNGYFDVSSSSDYESFDDEEEENDENIDSNEERSSKNNSKEEEKEEEEEEEDNEKKYIREENEIESGYEEEDELKECYEKNDITSFKKTKKKKKEKYKNDKNKKPLNTGCCSENITHDDMESSSAAYYFRVYNSKSEEIRSKYKPLGIPNENVIEKYTNASCLNQQNWQIKKYNTTDSPSTKNKLKKRKNSNSRTNSSIKDSRNASDETTSDDKEFVVKNNVTSHIQKEEGDSSCSENKHSKTTSKKENVKHYNKNSDATKKKDNKKDSSSFSSKQFKSFSTSNQENTFGDSNNEHEKRVSDMPETKRKHAKNKSNSKTKIKMFKKSSYSFFSSDDSSDLKNNQYYNFVKRELRKDEYEEDKNSEEERTKKEKKRKKKVYEDEQTDEEDIIQKGEEGENENRKDIQSYEERNLTKKKNQKENQFYKKDFQKNKSKGNIIYDILKKKTKTKSMTMAKTKKKNSENDTETKNKGGYEYFLKCNSLSYNVISIYEKDKRNFITIDFTHDAEGNPNEHIICGDILILMGHKNIENCCTCFPCSFSFHTGFLKKGSSEIIEIKKEDIDINNNYEHYIPDDMRISIILESATKNDALNAYKKYLKSKNKIDDLQMLRNFEKTEFGEETSSEDELNRTKDTVSYQRLEIDSYCIDGKNMEEKEEKKTNRKSGNDTDLHNEESKEEKENYSSNTSKKVEEYKKKLPILRKTKMLTKPNGSNEKKSSNGAQRTLSKVKSETYINNKLSLNSRLSYNAYTSSINGKESKGRYNTSNITQLLSSLFGFRNKEEKFTLNKKQKMIPLLISEKSFTNPISLKDYLKRQFDIITKPSANLVNFVKYHIVRIDQNILYELNKITKLSKIFLKFCIKLCLNDFFKTLNFVISMWGIEIIKMKKIKDKEILSRISKMANLSKEERNENNIGIRKTRNQSTTKLTVLKNLDLYNNNSIINGDVLEKMSRTMVSNEMEKITSREGSYIRKLKMKYKNKSYSLHEELQEEIGRVEQMEFAKRTQHKDNLGYIGLLESKEEVELDKRKCARIDSKKEDTAKKQREGKMNDSMVCNENEIEIDKKDMEKMITEKEKQYMGHKLGGENQKNGEVKEMKINEENIMKNSLSIIKEESHYKLAENTALEKIEENKFFYVKLPNGELMKLKIDKSTFTSTYDNMPLFVVESVDEMQKMSKNNAVETTIVNEKTQETKEEAMNANKKESTLENKQKDDDDKKKESETIPLQKSETSKHPKTKRPLPPLPEKYRALIKSSPTTTQSEEGNYSVEKGKEPTPKPPLQKCVKKVPPLPPGFLKNKAGALEKSKGGIKKCPMKMPPKLIEEKKVPEKRPLGIKLHWKLLPTHKIEGTVFSEIKNQEAKYNLIDTKAVHKLFARIKAEKKTENKKKAEEKKKTTDEKLLKVLDRNRAQNIAILLRFPITTEEIAHKINIFDLENMNIDFLQKVLHILPTKEESDCLLEKLKEENVKPEHFRDVERKLIPFVYLNKCKPKVEICLFSLKYDKMINEITTDLNIYDKAVKEVRSSIRLRSFLKAVLKWGNYVNYGINENEDLVALGFTLSSVLKLTEFKSSVDNSITSLHYIIVTLCMSMPNLNMKLLENDLETVLVASKMSSEAVDILLISLDKEIKFLKSQVNVDYDACFKEKMIKILQDSETKYLNVLKIYEEMKRSVLSISTYLGEETTGNGNLENIFIILTSVVNNFTKCYKDIEANPKKYFILLNDPNLIDEYNNIFSKKKKKNDYNSNAFRKKESSEMNQETKTLTKNYSMKIAKTTNVGFNSSAAVAVADTKENENLNEKKGEICKNKNSNNSNIGFNNKAEKIGNKSVTFMLRMQLLKEIQEKKLLMKKNNTEDTIIELEGKGESI